MNGIAVPGDGDRVQDGAIRLLNDLVGEDSKLEKVDDYKTSLLLRLDSLGDQLTTQQMQMSVVEREKQQRLAYICESNSRALQRARSAVSLVLSVSEKVQSITAGTIRLDAAQRNLTAMITSLQRFISYMDNMNHLEKMMMKQEFTNMASVLLATLQFASHFESMKQSQFVEEQLKRFEYLQKMLQRQVLDLFDSTMKRRGSIAAPAAIRLGHAAVIVDVLGEGPKKALIMWYCDRQLGDYKEVFRGNRELATLESVPKRYAWLKRLLIVYEAEHSVIFPEAWRVEEALCLHFCTITCKDITDTLQKSGSSVDLVLLQAAVQQTRSFEKYIQRRFAAGASSGLCISSAFEQHLFHFIDAYDKDIGGVVRRLPTELGMGDFDTANLLASAPELFLLYREILQDISDLSTKKPLLDLCVVFTKHLSAYSKYLEGRVPKIGKKPASTFQLKVFCVVLNTLDYCQITTEQMVDRIFAIAHPQFQEAICFDSVKQEFLVQVAVTIGKLYQVINTLMEGAWGSMMSTPWAALKCVGDQSTYVGQFSKILSEVLPGVRSTLVSHKHFVTLSNRLVTAIGRRFNENVLRIKPMNKVVAQQLLLDLESLRLVLLELMRPGDYGAVKNALGKLIGRETRDVENLLKVLLASSEPIGLFVQNYLLISANSSEKKFLAVLEMKGVKKALFTQYLEEFKKHVPDTPSAVNSIEEGRELKFFRIDEKFKKILANLGTKNTA